MHTSPKKSAFSLIEVTLALGIISFAFVAIFGMIPVGLNTARDSGDRTRGSQIAQRLATETQQTPFDQLGTLFGQVRYFDGEGEELATSTSATAGGPAGYVYTAVLEPATDLVQNSNASGVGISGGLTRIVIIKISKNRVVTALLPDEKPLAQTAFAIADLKL